VAVTSASGQTVGKSAFRHFLANNALLLVLYCFLILVMLGVSLYSPTFRSSANLWTLARQTAIPCIIAIAQTLLILSGAIDLSVAALVTFISLICSGLINSQDSLSVSISVLMLLVGLGVGAFNGLVVTRGHVPPFIATLGTALILQGLGLAYTTVPKGGVPTRMADLLYYGQVGPVPHPVILLILIFGLTWFMLSRTDFGRAIYAIGGNSEVARRAGIAVNRVRMTVFCLASLLVAVAGILTTARMGIGDPLAGNGMELDSITAVVIGGTSLFGGRGSLFGTFAGVLILTLINNVMVMTGINVFYQQLIKGRLSSWW